MKIETGYRDLTETELRNIEYWLDERASLIFNPQARKAWVEVIRALLSMAQKYLDTQADVRG